MQVSEQNGTVLSQVKISHYLCGDECTQEYVITSVVNVAGPASDPVILCAISSGNVLIFRLEL